MRLTLNKFSALRLLRRMRIDGTWGAAAKESAPLTIPSCEPAKRWLGKDVDVKRLQVSGRPTSANPLYVAVPVRSKRPQASWIQSTVYTAGLGDEPALAVDDDLSLVCPELLFVELARMMPRATHVLLGMELTGRFARDPLDPRDGKVTFSIPPVTTVERIAEFMDACSGVWGLSSARESLAYVRDNAWSPREALVACLALLPMEDLGYGLDDLTMNVRVDLDEDVQMSGHQARLPDMLLCGSDVGFNYDGEDHLDLDSIIEAAQEPVVEEGAEEQARAAHEAKNRSVRAAKKAVRAKVIDDQRRDRELAAQGKTVYRVTSEDLYEKGGLDMLMKIAFDALAKEGVDVTVQRKMLASRPLAMRRQQFIWSLLPGGVGRRNARALAAWKRKNQERLEAAAKEMAEEGFVL